MAERQRDLRDCLTAYDCRDQLPELSSWMDDDMLKQLTLWRGGRFQADEEYFDLDNPERGPFVATGDEGPITDHTYVARREVAEPAWRQLVTWEQPVSPDQAEAIEALAEQFDPGPPQSAAGDARPRPGARAGHAGGSRRGAISRLVADRGFGFIEADDDSGGGEFFFHRSALQGTRFEDLAPGTTVVFQVGEDPGDRPDEGPRAVSVRMDEGELPAIDPPLATEQTSPR